MKKTPLVCAGLVVLGSLAVAGASQDSRPALEESGVMRVAMTPHSPVDGKGLRWSPKGAKIELREVEQQLEGSIAIGPVRVDGVGLVHGPDALAILLTKSEGAEHVDSMWLDRNGDGLQSVDEQLEMSVSESRGKFWSSAGLTLQLPLVGPNLEAGEFGARDYPLNFWFVEDPLEPDAKPALRWSRKGWHQGEVQWKGAAMHVLITEMMMDGVFDERDAWSFSRDAETLTATASSRPLARHAWLGEEAFRMTSVDPNGMWIELESYDPGVTRAAEEEADDSLREDKRAERAEAPLFFGHDFEAAAAKAKAEGKVLLVDFETTWCGPCKTMDALVYTAKDVVDAATARGIIAVKVDGDERRDLKNAFAVEAFPTMILLDFETGEQVEAGRRVGYTSVKDMAAFLAGPAK